MPAIASEVKFTRECVFFGFMLIASGLVFAILL